MLGQKYLTHIPWTFGVIIWCIKTYALQKSHAVSQKIKENHRKKESMHLLQGYFINIWLYWIVANIIYQQQTSSSLYLDCWQLFYCTAANCATTCHCFAGKKTTENPYLGQLFSFFCQSMMVLSIYIHKHTYSHTSFILEILMFT